MGTWRGFPGWPAIRPGENIRRVLRAAVDFGIKALTVYAFSTENWGRPPEEVSGLMRILGQGIKRKPRPSNAEGVCIRHSGRLEGVNPKLAKQIQDAVYATCHNQTITLNVAFNYGGRAEIVDTVQHIMRDGHPPEAVTEDLISRTCSSSDLPDPDLIIRTGGEYRLSNFMIWQAAYTEYYATPTYWPDFDEAEIAAALIEYSQRKRRFGKVPNK